MKILRLDIGTTSIDWAIIEEGKEITKTGVLVWPKELGKSSFYIKKAPHCKARQGLNVFTTE